MFTKRILIVDDDDAILYLLQQGIVSFCDECQVILTTSGAAALHLLQQQRFDLILTDYDMPDMNGLELARAARDIWPGARIVLMSGGYGLGKRLAQGHNPDIEGFLQKPFSLRQIEQYLNVSPK